MALRFILVGLVASLGFEMPGAQDVASWTRAGRNWVDARLADVTSLRLEAARRFAEASDCERVDEPEPALAVEVASTRDDLTFEAVVDGMAKDFTADLALMEKARPVEEVIAAIEPSRDLPEVVFAPSQPEAAAVVEARPAPVEEPAPAPVPTQAATTSRVEKLSAAVRLTRQAVSAWAALIQPSSGEQGGDVRNEAF